MRSTGANNAKASRPLAVLCDFDDTIVLQNVAQLLLDRFGHGKWQELRKQLRGWRNQHSANIRRSPSTP